MHDINPLVHQLYLRDLECSALAARSHRYGERRTHLSGAWVVVLVSVVVLGVVLLGGQAADRRSCAQRHAGIIFQQMNA